MSKFNVGDNVKWNDGKYHNNNKRIDVITSVSENFFGDVQYMTKEINGLEGKEPKIGKAYESYLVLA